ncbi:uncharacterized protein METZ01_LOCUS414328 [marine metagenome]|uniref:CvpA family protein n=1 Tax=marine metagenome TaxID=408172 RepID=A0A382WS57_9ZZZZ
MSFFDFFIIFIVGICFLFSFYKGMVREVFSLLGYLCGYILAIDYYEDMASYLQSMISQEIMQRVSEFAIVFTVFKIIIAVFIFFTVKIILDLVGKMIRKGVEGTVIISFPDRLVGGILGAIKGLIIVVIILFPLSLFDGFYEKIVKGSVIAPYLENSISLIAQKSSKNKLLNFSSELSVEEIQENLKKIGDVDSIVKDLNDKKKELLNTIRSGIESDTQEEVMENYTKEDKNKLNDILEKLSSN